MDGRSHFHAELEIFTEKLLRMAALSRKAFGDAMRAFSGRDIALAKAVIDRDVEINRLECDLDEFCLRLLALEQPVALDLRRIVGGMRMIIDLERVGDEALHIAERAIFLAQLPAAPLPAPLEDLAFRAEEMLDKALAAFQAGDADLAQEVCRMDADIGDLNVRVIKDALGLAEVESCSPKSLERAIHEVIAARSLERIGDKAANIAEATIFIVKGVSVKHHCRPF
ncbi:phosphate signaling complex protein PhoU [Desulfolutivibrio sulfoxidireducens]|uniref:phosphate signaling complex protein PhoU n=1 Tax=Desulfolutivibrio sulfoxidireducens TaxID=2773299 RepID=UPI00159D1F19|nr:phosphate signaling complex protein PhoU [Desulfolutivibrio sulfoxidireducens]QLA21466.1 phosphate signaling complex protein PhoU [Desulfolutivibrio sulfoxidireducens]